MFVLQPSFAVAALACVLLANTAASIQEWNLPAGDDVLVFHSIYTSAADEAAKEASDRQGRSWGLLDERMYSMLLALAVTLGLLWLLRQLYQHRDRMSHGEFALQVNLMICVQGFINYSSVVLCAYPLCLALDLKRAASMSGLLIGIFMTASAAGTGLSWKILNMCPEVWRCEIKTFLVAGLSCQLVGALGLGKAAWGPRDEQAGATSLSMLMIARVLQGFGHGLNDQIMKCSIVKLAPVSDRPRHSLNKFVANTIGIGCGPILAAAVYFLFQDGKDQSDASTGLQISLLTAQLQFWTTFVVLATCVLLYPSMKEVEIHSGKPGTAAGGHQAKVLIIGLLMDALRAFIVSGVESATCFLLQDRFKWQDHSIGFAIGVTFCVAVPAYLIHRQYQAQLDDLSLMRIYTCLGILATLLLGVSTHPLGILCADSVIFPTTYLAGALNMGVLNSNVFPDGSMLNANNIMLINGLLSNGLARFTGPVFSRSLIEDLGQKAYAACQALATGSILAGSLMLSPAS